MLDELRHKINIADLIGRKVRLTRRGRNHTGLCPFHSEKSPSFNVQEDKGFYHCFGCGAHGDAFTFVMETEGLSFREAVGKLAEEQGIPSPLKGGQSQKEEKGASGRTLYEVMDLAVQWFEAQLASPSGSTARDYLKSRGLDGAARERFRLGFAPDVRTGLIGHLSSRGVSVDEMLAVGLALQPEDGRDPYDRFRGRLMFPIFDVRGRAIAFGGRTLLPDGKPKYLNSPETPLFKKGAVLFNHQGARTAAAKGQSVIVAEGYVDVIALVMAGFEGAVAPLGTALTEDQMALLWRMADEPVLCFDGDKAGIAAASRAIDRALPDLAPGKSLRFALLPGGQDPDDLIRAQGRDAMAWIIDGAGSLVDTLWERELQALDPTTPERRAGLRARLRALAAEVKDPDLRRDYAQALNDRLQALVDQRRNAGRSTERSQYQSRPGGTSGYFRGPAPSENSVLGREGRPGRRFDTPKPDAEMRASLVTAATGKLPNLSEKAAQIREAALILGVINHPFLLEVHLSDILNMVIHQPELDKIRQEILHAASLGNPLDMKGLRDHLNERGVWGWIEKMAQRPLLRVHPFVDLKSERHVVERDWRHAYVKHQKLWSLMSEHAAIVESQKGSSTDEAFRRIRQLDIEIKDLSGTEAGPPDRH